MYKFIIPFLPPSENSLYGFNGMTKQKYLIPSVKRFKNNCKAYIHDIPNLIGKLLRITFRFFGNWYFKNGKVRKKDGQNLTKALIDAIFEKINIDDCYIWESKWSKIQSKDGKEATEVTIEILGDSNEREGSGLSRLEMLKNK